MGDVASALKKDKKTSKISQNAQSKMGSMGPGISSLPDIPEGKIDGEVDKNEEMKDS